MNNKIRFLFLCVGLFFFGYMLSGFGWGNIVQNIIRTGWYFIPIIGVWLFVYLLNALAWSNIMHNKDISFGTILSVTIRGYALNYMTPFFHLGGEPYRVLALRNTLGTGKALSVTLSYLMLHFLSSFLFWIIAIVAIFFFLPVSGMAYIVLTFCLVVFFVASAFFMKGYKNGFIKSFSSFIVRMPLFKRFSEQVSNKEDFLNVVNSDIRELTGKYKKQFFLANLYELLSRFIATLEFYFILRAIGYNPTLMDSFLINAGASIISNLLFIVPFELGVKEGGLYVTLGLLHYLPAIGVFIGLVNRIRELFWIFIGLILIAVSSDKVNKQTMQGAFTHENTVV